LNLTQRLIESTLGVKSILFRPPYGIDHQPEYAEEVQQLPYPQELGYLIVGQRVDPDDWRMTEDKHQRPAEEIAAEVMRQSRMEISCCSTMGAESARRPLRPCR